jgi:methyl-accepting chemotaxis protein
MLMIRRAIGLVLIVVGVSGLAICYLGAKAGREVADNVANSADDMLRTASNTLDTVEQSLEQSRQTVAGINATIGELKNTTSNLALTVEDTQPTFDELALLVGEAIPGTISDLQETIPNIAQTAKVVDDTLRLLSRMRIEETVPIINYEISVGLGVDYNPAIPFDQAVEEVGRGLDPIASTSGNLESELLTTKANMAILSQDLGTLSTSLDELSGEVAAFRPLLDEYSSLVADMQEGIVDGRQQMAEQLTLIKQAVVVIAVWFGLFQLLPLYFGLELLMGNRMVRVVEIPSTAYDKTGDQEESASFAATSEAIDDYSAPAEADNDHVGGENGLVSGE